MIRNLQTHPPQVVLAACYATAPGSESRLSRLVVIQVGMVTLELAVNSYWMFFRVRVGAVSRDDVANPSKGSASTQPKTRSKDQPKDPGQNSAVIELSNSRHD